MSEADNRSCSAAKRARTNGSRREDDWTCPSCGNINFSFRTTCNLRNCTQSRPVDHYSKSAAKSLEGLQSYSMSSLFGSAAPPSMHLRIPHFGSPVFNGGSMPAYDVPFPRGSGYHYNYGNRVSTGGSCRSLPFSAPSPFCEGSMMVNGGLHGIPQIMNRYGMGVPMAPLQGPRPVFLPYDKPQKIESTRDNDWTCPKCGNVNFSFRSACNMRKCNTARPGSQPAKPDKNTKQKTPDGSWKCNKCNNINYPFRTKCNRQNCGADKPSDSNEFASPDLEENDQVH